MDNIGIGYKFKTTTGYSNELEGIDLKNGQVVWKRDLNREYGWNDVFYTNDSTIIVVAAGLHAMNVKTGAGWDYNTVTGKKDYTGTAAVNALGVAAGILTGTFVMATGHNLVRDCVSNAMTDSANIYFASREQLVKIDKQSGEILWKFPFANDLASKSSIFMNDSVVFMVNRGMAVMGARQLDFGKPFLAAFDRQTGEQLFFSLVNEKGDPILSYKIKNKEIFLAFKNRVAKYSLATGSLLAEKDVPTEDFGELKYFVGDQVFINNQNGDFVSLPQSDSTHVFVFTSQGKALSLDGGLEVSKTIEYDDLSVLYLRTNELKFIANDQKTLVVNNLGKRVAEIDVSSNANLIGHTLYDTQDDRFITMDLRQIIQSGVDKPSAQ